MGKRVRMDKGFVKDGDYTGCLPADIRRRLYDGAPETMTGTLRFDPDPEKAEGAVERFPMTRRLLDLLQKDLGDHAPGGNLHLLRQDVEPALAAARAELAQRGEERVVEIRRKGLDESQREIVSPGLARPWYGSWFLFTAHLNAMGMGEPGRYGIYRLPDEPEPEKVRPPTTWEGVESEKLLGKLIDGFTAPELMGQIKEELLRRLEDKDAKA